MAEGSANDEARIDRLVERSIEQAVFDTRRDFVKLVGAGAAAAALADVFPMPCRGAPTFR